MLSLSFRHCLSLLLFWLVVSGLPLASALPLSGESNPLPIKEWQKTLDDTEKELSNPEITDERLMALREEMLTLDAKLREVRDAANEKATVIRHDLDTLGPVPAEDAPPEAATVIARRKVLNEGIATAEGGAKEADLLLGRNGRVFETIKHLRQSRFTQRVLTQSASPLSETVWNKAQPEWQSFWTDLAMPVRTWLQKPEWSQVTRDRLWRLLMGVGLALLLAFPIRTRLARRMMRNLPAGPPTDLYRIRSAALTGLLHAWLPSMAAIAIYLSLVTGGGLAPEAVELAGDALLAAVLVFVVVSIARAALRPNRSTLRLAPLSDAGARRVYWVVVGLAWLFAFHFILSSALKSRDVSLEVIATELLVFSSLVSLVLSGLLSRQVWTRPGHLYLKPFRRGQRLVLGLLIMAIPVSAMTGYVGLSRLLAIHGVVTMALLALLALLMRISDEFAGQLLSAESRSGNYLRRQLALTSEGAEMLEFWIVVAMKTFIVTAGGLAMLFLWSLDRKDLMLWLGETFQGFKLGNITISPLEILLGLLLFTLLLTATRLIQRTLDRRIFPRTRLDMGARTSIRAAVGYAGFTLAALFGISTMGIDFSSLAMIAGALSVGIGFGLQNIVNNFVSGLILLIERPIKVGDWVVVGDLQGHVKQISVRATEIITFDRASVFIPNSSLISGTVMNRTHADRIGRIVLPIGIDHDADVNRTRELLLRIAGENPAVRDNPAPAVLMSGFGDSALKLELVAFVNDVEKVKGVTSELLFAIHAAFRQQGIQTPSPQRDLKLTLDDEQLRRMFLGGLKSASQADENTAESYEVSTHKAPS